MRVFITLLLVSLLAACKDRSVSAGVLPEEKMEKVLWELLQADEWAFHLHPLDTAARKRAALQHYAEIYRMNGIDAKTFRESYNYYSERPTILSPVLDSIRNKANQPPEPIADPKPRKILRPQ